MTTFETLRLFAVIVAIYSIPAAIYWYLVDRKIKVMEKKLFGAMEEILIAFAGEINDINSRVRNIK